MTATSLSIILKHLITALQSIQRDIQEAERDATHGDAPTKQPAEDIVVKPRRFLKLVEGAAFLNVSKATRYKLTMTRKIPFYKVASRTMFSEEQLLTWVKSFERPPEKPLR